MDDDLTRRNHAYTSKWSADGAHKLDGRITTVGEMRKTPIIEPYRMDHNEGPRNCQYDPGAKQHPAELIIHSVDGRFEKFLCKDHVCLDAIE